MTTHLDADYAGARAALSGFRRQALLTLDLLLTESDTDTIVQPEGREDVSVIRKGKVCRAIQVKAYAADLTLSHLEPQKNNSFLRRAARNLDEDCSYELASFGPLGEELAGVYRGDETATKIISERLRDKHNFTDTESLIIGRIKIHIANDRELKEKIDSHLSKTLTAGDPAHAFELLIAWILHAAENREKLRLSDLQAKLTAIGRYFSEREAHHTEWNKTIVSLVSSQPSASEQDALGEEYYRGAAARYSHICAGLDVQRSSLLERIHQGFASKRVVILHGLSGQGKTSLALRYLHNYVPETWRFWIKAIDDRAHAFKLAHAISDHLHNFKATAHLFLDITHKDLDWTVLVKELLDKPNVKILVAIREEDLARQTASGHELGFPDDIKLQFTDAEAEPIYSQLLARGNTRNAYPTFEEAWNRFGGRGPLLEFVYLITQTDSLKSVLQSQVARIRTEIQSGQLETGALEFLRVCAVATAYEARVLARPLARHLGLADPTRVMQLLESEYLLRHTPDQTQVEAVHPVRSELLAQILDDPSFSPRIDTILSALKFIPEIDLEVFLLHALSRYQEAEESLIDNSLKLDPQSWSGAVGISHALLWAGIRLYISQNRGIFDQLSGISERAWLVLLPDPAQAMGEDVFANLVDLIEGQSKTNADLIRRCRDGLSAPSLIYAYLRTWISSLTLTEKPSNIPDWEGLAEITYWCGHLRVPFAGHNLLRAIPTIDTPLETLGRACLALSAYDQSSYGNFISEHGDQLRQRLQRESQIFRLEEGIPDVSLTAHFIVPLALLSDKEELSRADPSLQGRIRPANEILMIEDLPRSVSEESFDVRLNNEAVSRASLLRAIFPDKDLYCTRGHGQNLEELGVIFPHDSTVKNIPRKNLPVPWLVKVNSIYVNLVDFPKRPVSWKAYAELIIDLRLAIVRFLERLFRSVEQFFEGRKPKRFLDQESLSQSWKQAKAALTILHSIPASAVDEWGYSGDGTRKSNLSAWKNTQANLATIFALRNNTAFAEALSTYSSAASNFLQHAEFVCACHGFLGRCSAAEKRRILEVSTAAGYSDHRVNLTIYNLFDLMKVIPEFQRTFADRFATLLDPGQVSDISRRETALFPSFWCLWHQFAHNPELIMTSAGTRALSGFESRRNEFVIALRNEFAKLGDCRASIVFEGNRANDVLLVSLNIESIVQFESSRQSLFSALDRVFMDLGIGTLSRHVLEYYWSRIVVIPTTDDKTFGTIGWTIGPAAFSPEGGKGCGRSWTRLALPVVGIELESYGFTIGGSSTTSQALLQLEKALGGVSTFLVHMSKFGVLDDLDGLGVEVLRTYFDASKPELIQNLDNIVSSLPIVISEFEAELQDHDLATEILTPLHQLNNDLLSSDGELTFSPATAKEQAESYRDALLALFILKMVSVANLGRLYKGHA